MSPAARSARLEHAFAAYEAGETRGDGTPAARAQPGMATPPSGAQPGMVTPQSGAQPGMVTPGAGGLPGDVLQAPHALPGIAPYITAGFPYLDSTSALLLAAQRAGSLFCEVGIPFSDPLADGPTIQRTSQRALELGMTPTLALEQIATARADGVTIPLVVMTYTNIVLAPGAARFAQQCVGAGVDALIIPDLPVGEGDDIHAACRQAGLAVVALVAPNTADARLRTACAASEGFVYCVGVTGVTGSRREVSPEALDLLERVRAVTALPRALGFGISTHEHVAALRGHAEAAVVGSALLDAVSEAPGDAPGVVERFLRSLRDVPA